MAEVDGRIPYKKTSRADYVSDIIKQRILDGIWKPGQRLDDLELSEELGVSRISVREALSRLVENRILTKVHWKGYYVCDLSWPEIESIIDIRESLEELALRKCLEKNDPELLKELEEGIRRSEEDLEKGDRKAFFHSDFLFHEILYKGSGNDWVAYFALQTKFFTDFLRLLDKEDQFDQVSRISIDEHREILDFMIRNEPEEALKSMTKQIRNHKTRVREIFERHQREDSE